MLEHIIETYIVTDSEGRTETPEHGPEAESTSRLTRNMPC